MIVGAATAQIAGQRHADVITARRLVVVQKRHRRHDLTRSAEAALRSQFFDHGCLNGMQAAVFAFDEVDKLEEVDFLYSILEDIYKKSIILVTNEREWLEDLDDRVKSRSLPETIEFKPYSLEETRGVLKQRVQYAFVPGIWADDAFELIVNKTAEVEDIRIGLHLMRGAGNIAEEKSSRKITSEHVKEAIMKIDQFTIKKSSDLTGDEQKILEMIKKNSDKKIGDLYNIYKDQGGTLVYKSFQRKIEKLEKSKFVSVKKTSGGADGNTSIVKYANVTKKLTEF